MTLRQQHPEKAESRARLLTELLVRKGFRPEIQHDREGYRKVRATLTLHELADGKETHRIVDHFKLGELRRADYLCGMLRRAHRLVLEGEGHLR